MIDYDYYTKLNDKDLDKIISHVKNIQNQRLATFENAFFLGDTEKLLEILPILNKDKLKNTFEKYQSHFTATDEQINFYLFLKHNDYTKDLDYSSLEHTICWQSSNIDMFEKIKEQFPETFKSFKNRSFHYSHQEMIPYLHINDMIDFDKVKKSTHITEELLSYMLNKKMFSTFEDLPLSQWFPSMSEKSLLSVISHFHLSKLNLEDFYLKCGENNMKDYMKNSFKYNSPDFLDNFIINDFFVKEISKTIDKVSDKYNPLSFVVKTYELIKKEDSSLQENLVFLLKNGIKKPKNKDLISKIDLNFNFQNLFPEKNSTSPFLKI